MRLLPFVKRLQIVQHYTDPWFPNIFDARGLVYFSALTNVQELGIDELHFCAFTPQAQRYLGHLMSTIRSLALRNPTGTGHQLLYFLGLFPNLDDFKLSYSRAQHPTPAPAPIPQSAPFLRGRLTLTWVTKEGFLRDLSELSGGLRFRYMDLVGVGDTRFLLDTCADTLETLRVYPVYWTGKDVLKRCSPRPFDPPTHRNPKYLTTRPRPVEKQVTSVSRDHRGEPQSVLLRRSNFSQEPVTHDHITRVF